MVNDPAQTHNIGYSYYASAIEWVINEHHYLFSPLNICTEVHFLGIAIATVMLV